MYRPGACFIRPRDYRKRPSRSRLRCVTSKLKASLANAPPSVRVQVATITKSHFTALGVIEPRQPHDIGDFPLRSALLQHPLGMPIRLVRLAAWDTPIILISFAPKADPDVRHFRDP